MHAAVENRVERLGISTSTSQVRAFLIKMRASKILHLFGVSVIARKKYGMYHFLKVKKVNTDSLFGLLNFKK